MNTLIVNRDTFRMPEDGWYQLAPLGEFPHTAVGVIQVVDTEACVAMVARFTADAAVDNFAGLLVDFDHFSLDDRARSEAAGWIAELTCRETGLWGKIRWSDLGEEAVKGGRYRFLSPVWARSDCVDLGNGRVRPVRLLNAAVTNDPNLKGLMPLANSGPVDSRASYGEAHGVLGKDGLTMKRVIETLVNHLGLGADATEDAILEKMQGLPGLTAVADLQNSLRDLQGKHDALATELKEVEGELVNRHLTDFEGVISDGAKAFWSEQLLRNREGALVALGDMKKGAEARGAAEDGRGDAGTRKPLHNRATARPVPPGQGAQGSESDGKAVKIRNRAHELVKAEGVPFTVAFRRAEKEVTGQ